MTCCRPYRVDACGRYGAPSLHGLNLQQLSMAELPGEEDEVPQLQHYTEEDI